jgi:cyclic pyranopterin monophosphate synthase
MTDRLTHIDTDGRASMVDVSAKADTKRIARAEGRVLANAQAVELARTQGGKGDVRACAEIAGVMAAKRTSDLIPMCHPLRLSSVRVRVDELEGGEGFSVVAEVATTGPTGVEMEALTAVSVACLTVYDMLKAVDRAMRIEGIRLLAKSGGASGDFVAE